MIVFICDHCGEQFPTQHHRIEHLLDRILRNQERIMSSQQDIDAAVTVLQDTMATVVAVTTDLSAAAANIQAEIAALVAAGTPVDTTALNAAVDALTTTLAPLQAAQAAVDALETPATPVV